MASGNRAARAAAMAKLLNTPPSPVMRPEMRAPLASLLSQAYGKPVEIRFTPLAKPHLDSSILASVLTQKLKDRRVTSRTVIRDSVWTVPLPAQNQVPSSADHADVALRAMKRRPALRSVGMKKTPVAQVIDEMKLKQVSSLSVEVAGRLGKRMTANRSERKAARKGLSSKAAGYMIRGIRPSHQHLVVRNAKRKVGAFGVRITVGHS